MNTTPNDNLPPPHPLIDPQLLHQIRPPRPAPLLPPQIVQHLLPPVHQDPHVAQVVLVLLVRLVGQRVDLGREDRGLHFAGAGVAAGADGDLGF